MTKRWEKESSEFLDALTGGNNENPLKGKGGKTAEDERKARELHLRQTTAGGRPRNGTTVSDPLVTYNFKIKESELRAVKKLSLDRTLTIRELMSEAIGDLLKKYGAL